jgi:hypothetical protein
MMPASRYADQIMPVFVFRLQTVNINDPNAMALELGITSFSYPVHPAHFHV